MFKRKIVVVLMLVFVAASVFWFVKFDVFKASNPFKSEIIRVDNGYGYQISYHSKLLIKQEYIPEIQLNKTFCTEQDAEKVAHLVCEKLYKKESPKITLENLNQLNINLNCNN